MREGDQAFSAHGHATERGEFFFDFTRVSWLSLFGEVKSAPFLLCVEVKRVKARTVVDDEITTLRRQTQQSE